MKEPEQVGPNAQRTIAITYVALLRTNTRTTIKKMRRTKFIGRRRTCVFQILIKIYAQSRTVCVCVCHQIIVMDRERWQLNAKQQHQLRCQCIRIALNHAYAHRRRYHIVREAISAFFDSRECRIFAIVMSRSHVPAVRHWWWWQQTILCTRSKW